jgi:MFS family permease
MTTTSDSLAGARAAEAARGRWLMLIVLLAGQFMALLDVTIATIAMPAIGRSLHATGARLQLVLAGYTVSYATLLMAGAPLGHLNGRRRIFLIGVRCSRWPRWPAGSCFGPGSSSPPGSSRARRRRRCHRSRE